MCERDFGDAAPSVDHDHDTQKARGLLCKQMEPPSMQRPKDLSKSLTVLKQDNTLIAVIEMSLSNWLVAGVVPSVERQPLKKFATFGRL